REFVDELAASLEQLPPSQVRAVEKGPGEAREFFQKWRWLFASRYDLALLECKIEQEKEKRKPSYLGLDDPCEETVEVTPNPDEQDLILLTDADRKKKAPAKKVDSSRGDDDSVARDPETGKKLSELQRFQKELEP